MSKRALAREARRSAYRVHRGLYKDDKSQLGKLLLDGSVEKECEIGLDIIHKECSEILGTKGDVDVCALDDYPTSEELANNPTLLLRVTGPAVV